VTAGSLPYLLFYRVQDEVFSLLRVLHERRTMSAEALRH
jgi:toxin ParE1/3/4